MRFLHFVVRLVAIVVLVTLVSRCNFFFHKADKDRSDLNGIIPVASVDSGRYAKEARYNTWPNPDTIIIYIDQQRYRVTKSGDVIGYKCKQTDGSLSLGIKYNLQQLYFAQRGRDLFIFYTDVNALGSGSYIRRINVDNGKILWTAEVDGFSFTKPLIKGGFAYIATLGFIGKVKLSNGKFDWRFANLGKNGRYNNFRDIDIVDGGQVRFVAPHAFSAGGDTIIVSDFTGEVVKMTL